MTRSVEATVPERRRSPRRAVSQLVKLEIDDAVTIPHALLVTDISDGGARLFAQDVDLPSEFILVFLESAVRRKCRVIWRIGPEAGLEYVDQDHEQATRRRR